MSVRHSSLNSLFFVLNMLGFIVTSTSTTTPVPVTKKPCSNYAEIKIFADISGSIPKSDFEYLKLVIQDIVRHINTISKANVTMTYFGGINILKEYTREIKDETNKENLIYQIGLQQYPSGNGADISCFDTKFFSTEGLRVFFLFSDGYYAKNEQSQIEAYSNAIKSQNAEMFAFATSDQYDLKSLGRFSNKVGHLILVNDYTKIYELLNEMTIDKCNGYLFLYNV